MDYTRLSLSEVFGALEAVARDTQATFAQLGARPLNWRPGETRWSVAQCFEHLLTANGLLLVAARHAVEQPAEQRMATRAAGPGDLWPTDDSIAESDVHGQVQCAGNRAADR